jgi:hypothetical protein
MIKGLRQPMKSETAEVAPTAPGAAPDTIALSRTYCFGKEAPNWYLLVALEVELRQV